MEKRFGIRLAIVCGLCWGMAAICVGQAYTPPPPPLTTLPPCPLGKDGKPLKKKKNCDPTIYPSEKVESKKKPDVPAASATQSSGPLAAQKFPFPSEQAKPADTPAAKAFPFPGSESVEHKSGDSEVQHDPAAEKKAAETPAGKAFPFPGDKTPDMPTDPDMPVAGGQPSEAPSSSSSSSSTTSPDDGTRADGSGGSSPMAPDAPGPRGEYDDDDSTTPKLKDKSRKKVPPPQTDTARVDEDLSVARYYGQSGNNMGAYLRAKDAVKVQPEYPEGHFVFGEAARRLGKKDEAVAEFTTYLKLAPDGEHARAAEKALDNLR